MGEAELNCLVGVDYFRHIDLLPRVLLAKTSDKAIARNNEFSRLGEEEKGTRGIWKGGECL